jgi:hypothetical protein
MNELQGQVHLSVQHVLMDITSNLETRSQPKLIVLVRVYNISE